jgi:hypothetical protein
MASKRSMAWAIDLKNNELAAPIKARHPVGDAGYGQTI